MAGFEVSTEVLTAFAIRSTFPLAAGGVGEMNAPLSAQTSGHLLGEVTLGST